MTEPAAASLSQRIAKACSAPRLATITPGSRTRMRWSALDFVGCTIAGASLPDVGPALCLAHAGDIAVPGLDRRFDAPGAALTMGTAGALMQMHDVYLPGHIHASSPIMPAAWAIWRERGGSVDTFLTALIAGYETTNRMAATTYPVQQRAGSTPTATLGAIGAAVAAGVMAGLDEATLAVAITNAAMLAPLTPFQALRDHGSAVPLHSGAAARAGVEAVMLAEGGWTAGPHALEGTGPQPGWLAILQGDPSLMTPETWDWTTIDKVIWKLIPACYASLPSIEAALRAPRLDAEQIARLQIRMPLAPMTLVGEGPIAGGGLYDQLMSVRWPVAHAVLSGEFNAETVLRHEANPAFERLLAKTEVVHDPELDAYMPEQVAATIRWTLTDGTVGEVSHHRLPLPAVTDGRAEGWIARLDEAALSDKYQRLTAHRRDEAAAIREELLSR